MLTDLSSKKAAMANSWSKIKVEPKAPNNFILDQDRIGFGLRHHHFSSWIENPAIPILEIMSDNILGHKGGPALGSIDKIAERTKFVMHGVGLNIASSLELDFEYLKGLKTLAERYAPEVISDHLCFTRVFGISSFELLPFPKTKSYLAYISERILRVQDFLKANLSLENISSYVSFDADQMTEGEFIAELCHLTSCNVLLDINNIFVNSFNFSFDPFKELFRYPLDKVSQIHLAGHTCYDDYYFDTHDQPVCEQVMQLLSEVLPMISSKIPIIIEWDDVNTELPKLLQEKLRVTNYLRDKFPEKCCHAQ